MKQPIVCNFYTVEQGWPTFFPKQPILFKSSSYPPHKRKTSKLHSDTKLFFKKKEKKRSSLEKIL